MIKGLSAFIRNVENEGESGTKLCARGQVQFYMMPTMNIHIIGNAYYSVNKKGAEAPFFIRNRLDFGEVRHEIDYQTRRPTFLPVISTRSWLAEQS